MLNRASVQSPAEWLPSENFQQVPNDLVSDVRRGKLSPIDIAVYMVLLHHLGKNACCWVGNPKIAQFIGKDVKTVNRSIKRLQAADYIARPTFNDATSTKNTFILIRVKDGRVVRFPAPVIRTAAPPQANFLTDSSAAARPDVEISKDELREILGQDAREDDEAPKPEQMDEL